MEQETSEGSKMIPSSQAFSSRICNCSIVLLRAIFCMLKQGTCSYAANKIKSLENQVNLCNHYIFISLILQHTCNSKNSSGRKSLAFCSDNYAKK